MFEATELTRVRSTRQVKLKLRSNICFIFIWVGNLAARVAGCKPVTLETSLVRVQPGPPRVEIL